MFTSAIAAIRVFGVKNTLLSLLVGATIAYIGVLNYTNNSKKNMINELMVSNDILNAQVAIVSAVAQNNAQVITNLREQFENVLKTTRETHENEMSQWSGLQSRLNEIINEPTHDGCFVHPGIQQLFNGMRRNNTPR